MSFLSRIRQPVARRGFTVASAALLLLTTLFTGTASAHGSVTNPPARAYSCFDRWGDQWQAPEMETEDPMCWQAWQANPDAMWNWNGLYRENVGGNHQGAIASGSLCSGGNTQGGRYAALDTPGPWQGPRLSNNFSLTLTDPSTHGADYLQIYVTKQGFNPETQRLGWGNLDLVTETGPSASNITVNVSAPGRTGHHIVYTVWQASHLDQSYYFCSDVYFG